MIRLQAHRRSTGSPPAPGGGSWPTWRQGLAVDVMATIPGTDLNDSGIDFTPFQAYYTIGSWCGLACAGSKLISAANGGHMDSGDNGVYMVDLAQDEPGWTTLRAPTNPPSYWTEPTGFYQGDGRPISSHTYYALQYIPQRSRIFRMYVGSGYGTSGGTSGTVDAFHPAFLGGDDDWDAAGTYASMPFVTAWTDAVGCTNPATGDVYAGKGTNFYKWTQATATWSADINPSGHGDFQVGWTPTFIDVGRNRWVNFGIDFFDAVDLTALSFTGPHNWTGLVGEGANWTVAGGAATHDTYNDKYLWLDQDGRLWRGDPNTLVASRLMTTTAAAVAPYNRFHYMHDLGGVAYYPSAGLDVHFLPTRSAP